MAERNSPRKPRRSEDGYTIDRHFVFLEVPVGIVGPQAMLWGEAEWWPRDCPMRFVKETQGETGVGTRFRMELKGSKEPPWTVEVAQWDPNKFVQRIFVSGMLKGFEVIKIGERSNGTRVDYEMYYSVREPLKKILWPFLYKKRHEDAIEKILNALKEYCVAVYREQKEKELEEK